MTARDWVRVFGKNERVTSFSRKLPLKRRTATIVWELSTSLLQAANLDLRERSLKVQTFSVSDI